MPHDVHLRPYTPADYGAPPRTVLTGGTAQYAFLTPDRAQVLAACVTAAAMEARGEHPAHVADHAWIMFSGLVDHAAGRAG